MDEFARLLLAHDFGMRYSRVVEVTVDLKGPPVVNDVPGPVRESLLRGSPRDIRVAAATCYHDA